MADTTEFTGTQQNPRGTGLIPQAGQFLSNVQQIANQPSVQRSLPAVIAVVVLILGLFVYSILQQPERTTLYASLPDAEKSKVQDALKNMGVDVTLDPTTGEILVPVEDYHRSRISLAAQGLPSSSPDGYSTLTDLPMGSSRSVERMRLKQTQESWSDTVDRRIPYSGGHLLVRDSVLTHVQRIVALRCHDQVRLG